VSRLACAILRRREWKREGEKERECEERKRGKRKEKKGERKKELSYVRDDVCIGEERKETGKRERDMCELFLYATSRKRHNNATLLPSTVNSLDANE